MTSQIPFDRSQAPKLEELSAILPAYQFNELVAVGGMGAIYHAEQRSLEREVAVKILPKHFGQDASFRKMFNEEARAMGRLNHRNLVSVYDFGEEGGYHYIVMEYVNGSSLHDAVGGRPVEDAQCAEIIRAICDGLGHAHSEGILHRDIKPPNILLTMDCVPKVADFGLARDAASFDKDEVVWGTPGFIAPEAIRNSRLVDARSDIYSLGAVLYFLLTARIPKEKRIPASLRVQSAVELDYIIDKAMHTDPSLRYANCGEFKEDIEKVIDYLKSLKKQGMGQGIAMMPHMVRPKAPDVGTATQRLNIPSSQPLNTPASQPLHVPASAPLQAPVYPTQATMGMTAPVYVNADMMNTLAAAGVKPHAAPVSMASSRGHGSPLSGMTAPVYVHAAMAEALSGAGLPSPAPVVAAPSRIGPNQSNIRPGFNSLPEQKKPSSYSLIIIVVLLAALGFLLLSLTF